MPHSFGLRSKTRDLFQKDFGKRGQLPLQVFLKTYRIGQIVDIKGDAGQHKGMPHKFYHGKTGRVWNVTPRAVGVEVNKRVGNRIIPKRIHVRIEHVKHSKCRTDFLTRVVENEKKKNDAKAAGKPVPMVKRIPLQPKPGRSISGTKITTLTPVPFKQLYT
jgi:large subunit ribosomal protein L21e